MALQLQLRIDNKDKQPAGIEFEVGEIRGRSMGGEFCRPYPQWVQPVPGARRAWMCALPAGASARATIAGWETSAAVSSRTCSFPSRSRPPVRSGRRARFRSTEGRMTKITLIARASGHVNGRPDRSIPFVSTCLKCGRPEPQLAFSRRALQRSLD